MTATLTSSVDAVMDGARRVVDLAEDLAAAAVDLSELWAARVVEDAISAAFKAQQAAADVGTAAARLHEAVR